MSDEVIWILYFMLILWITLLLNPWIVLLIPFIIFILFKFIKFKLKVFQSAPFRQTTKNEIGGFILIFLNITFMAIVIIIGIFMTFTMTHTTYKSGSNTIVCGPFK